MKRLNKIDRLLVSLGILFFIVGGFLLYSPKIQIRNITIASPLHPQVAAAATGDYKIKYQVTSWLYLGASEPLGGNTGFKYCNDSHFNQSGKAEDGTNSLAAVLGPYSWEITGSIPNGGSFKETWQIGDVIVSPVSSSCTAGSWSDDNVCGHRDSAKTIKLTNDDSTSLATANGAFPNNILVEYDTELWTICKSQSQQYIVSDQKNTDGASGNAGSYGALYTKYLKPLGAQPTSWIINGTVTP